MSNLEGTELDIAGTVKPRVYGDVRSVLPKLVNAARQRWQVSDQYNAFVHGVYDGGAPFSLGASYSSLLQLRSVDPTGGQQRAFAGYFAVGSVPVRELTCDASCGYLPNPDFEAGATDWTLLGSGTVVIANDPANAFSGSWVLKRTGTDGVAAEIARNAYVFPVTPGQPYAVGGAVKCSTAAGGAGQAEVGYVWLNSSMAEIAAERHIWTPATAYSVKEGRFVPPVGTAYGCVSIVVRSQTTGTWSFDRIRGGSTRLGDVARMIAAERGFTVDAGDIAIANLADDAGIYADDSKTTAELLDLLAASLGGYRSFSNNHLRMRPLEAPGVPSITIQPHEVIQATRDATALGSNGLPIWRVVVRGDRIGSVQRDTSGSANASRLATEYREAVWESQAVKTRHPFSEELVIETGLRTLAGCQAVADRLGPIVSVPRHVITATIRFSPKRAAAIAEALNIGSTVRLVTVPKWGYAAGRNVVVLGSELDARRRRAELDLVG